VDVWWSPKISLLYWGESIHELIKGLFHLYIWYI
jgi:hypothetical protein